MRIGRYLKHNLAHTRGVTALGNLKCRVRPVDMGAEILFDAQVQGQVVYEIITAPDADVRIDDKIASPDSNAQHIQIKSKSITKWFAKYLGVQSGVTNG